MPKVTDAYIQEKKKRIIEAAYELCIRKTVSTVTMQDIINETGLSQGGIYRFYRDIDEIFHDMLYEHRQRVNIKDKIDEIYDAAFESEPSFVIHQTIELLSEFMIREIDGIVKINFEIKVLTMNSPGRVEKILGGLPEMGNFEYILFKTAQYIEACMEKGLVKPRISYSEIISYIISDYNGIEMLCIINHCYKGMPLTDIYTPDKQLVTLEKTINYLLGLEE